MSYILGIDQSTQGTKAILVDKSGKIVAKKELAHRQLINESGWVSHDPEEIYQNVLKAAVGVIEEAEIEKSEVAAVGISNQRETTVMWDRVDGHALGNAIVWQCSRATEICERTEIKEQAEVVRERTGINLSPYFPAAKIAWLLENTPGAKEKAEQHSLCHGTVDSWLVYRLTDGKSYKTDYSNASRTQLFNIFDLQWDREICELFGIDSANLPQVCDSDAVYGMTDFGGFFDRAVPIHCVMGDSHGALFGQKCLNPGEVKATYGTGSSIMMNIGAKPIRSNHGVVTSIAWGRSGKVNYVLEGNLNYTGAVITWLKDDLGLISSPAETESLAEKAVKADQLYLVPAFSGLGAPYWDSHANAAIVGMSRTTGKAELVRAGLECIAYQITDIVRAMEQDSNMEIKALRVDGGPTSNRYLMQFQSDILNAAIQVPNAKELSAIGVSYCAGIAAGVFESTVFEQISRQEYHAEKDCEERERLYLGWKDAVKKVLTK